MCGCQMAWCEVRPDSFTNLVVQLEYDRNMELAVGMTTDVCTMEIYSIWEDEDRGPSIYLNSGTT